MPLPYSPTLAWYEGMVKTRNRLCLHYRAFKAFFFVSKNETILGLKQGYIPQGAKSEKTAKLFLPPDLGHIFILRGALDFSPSNKYNSYINLQQLFNWRGWLFSQGGQR